MTDKHKDTGALANSDKNSVGGTGNPQNMNNSPSPGGDGVQSSASEKAAAGTTINQPAQRRINAAERRERQERGEGEGQRPSLVQSPGEMLPYEDVLNAQAAAAETAKKEAEKGPPEGLPRATLEEMEAGKAALEGRGRPAAPQNPVDDLGARKSSEVKRA